MALKGNLRDFTITQLLNLVSLARKTGALIVEGSSEAVCVFFRDGKLAYAMVGQDDNSLINILSRNHKLTVSQQRAIRESTQGMSDKELGLHLINANYLSQQEILSSLQSHFTGILSRLFTWADGVFRFENETRPPEDKITIRVNLENIILESSRRLREWDQLKDEIPSLQMALKFAERPSANIRKLNLSVEEWRVVSYINPKNTMQQIARATQLNDLEIRRIVYSLLQAGVVEIVRPAGGIHAAPSRGQIPVSPKKANSEEQRSLLNRIIARIRAL